jgi:imidazolonepropionase-like amidohydrolase
MKSLLGVLSVLFATATARADSVAVRAGHLVDPAAGTATANQIILIEDGKIKSIGASTAIPANTQVIDLSNEWVLPGMVDAHTHITMNLPPSPPGESLWEKYLLSESDGIRTARGLRNADLLLHAGFLAVRDVGNGGNFADTAVRQAIEKGWFPGPTVVNCGKIIGPFGGQSHGYAPEQGPFWLGEYFDADSPDEIRKAVRKNIYYGATCIKLVSDNSAYHYSEADVRAAVDEAHRAGLTVADHLRSDEPTRDAVNGGIDSVEHGYFLTPDVLKLMKKKGTWLVGTDFPYEHMVAFGSIGDLDAKTASEAIVTRLANAHKIGVRMAFGSDVVAELPGKNRADMIFDFLDVWKKAGIPNADILRAWTTNGFELLHLTRDRGSIAVGKAGDLIAVPGNPLADIYQLKRVNFVMKDGKVVRTP